MTVDPPNPILPPFTRTSVTSGTQFASPGKQETMNKRSPIARGIDRSFKGWRAVAKAGGGVNLAAQRFVVTDPRDSGMSRSRIQLAAPAALRAAVIPIG